jgi:hypothetical protein
MKRLLMTFAVLFFAAHFISAQETSPQNLNWKGPESPRGTYAPDIFLQGTFIEVGVNDAATFGSTTPAPAGFHPRMGSGTLGFVADWEMNGWDNSSAPGIPFYSGDYFLPGGPWEGFLVAYTTATGSRFVRRNYGAELEYGIPPIAGSIANTSAGSTQSSTWAGTMAAGGQSLLVEQLTYFNVGEARFFAEITLTNTGTETLINVEYARSLDPDQEQNLTGSFTTTNWVSNPTGAITGFTEAIAIGLAYQVPLALRLYHPNAVASINADWPLTDPATTLDSPFQPTEGAPLTADWALEVAVRFPSLAPGASETFLVSYVLNQDEIDDPTPPEPIPVSNWALYLGILLMVTFVVIRFRRMI